MVLQGPDWGAVLGGLDPFQLPTEEAIAAPLLAQLEVPWSLTYLISRLIYSFT